MVAWLMQRSLQVLDLLDDVRTDELTERLGLDEAELGRWKEMAVKMRIHCARIDAPQMPLCDAVLPPRRP